MRSERVDPSAWCQGGGSARVAILMRPSPRLRVCVALLALAMTACGGAPAPAALDATSARVEAPIVPFHVTLPVGDVVALREGGVITVNGEVIGVLQEDGRVEDPEGHTMAALLVDGRISFGGGLTPTAIADDGAYEHGRALLELRGDLTLALRPPDGSRGVSVPVVGVTRRSRATVLFVISVHFIRLAQLAAHERIAQRLAAPPDVEAPPPDARRAESASRGESCARDEAPSIRALTTWCASTTRVGRATAGCSTAPASPIARASTR